MSKNSQEVSVGKRFLLLDETSSSQGEVRNWNWKSGIIRCASHSLLSHKNLQFLVEFDKVPWQNRDWINVYSSNFKVFLIEKDLRWSHRNGSEPEAGFTFKQLIDTIGFWKNKQSKPIFYLKDSNLDFTDVSKSKIIRNMESLGRIGGIETKPHYLLHWSKRQKTREVFQSFPNHLRGLRVQVYRSEGTTQWYTAVINSFNETTKEFTLTDDTVLEKHYEDPKLTQMKILSDGVIESILKGEEIGRSPRSCQTRNKFQSLEKLKLIIKKSNKKIYTSKNPRNKISTLNSKKTLCNSDSFSGIVTSRRDESQHKAIAVVRPSILISRHQSSLYDFISDSEESPKSKRKKKSIFFSETLENDGAMEREGEHFVTELKHSDSEAVSIFHKDELSSSSPLTPHPTWSIEIPLVSEEQMSSNRRGRPSVYCPASSSLSQGAPASHIAAQYLSGGLTLGSPLSPQLLAQYQSLAAAAAAAAAASSSLTDVYTIKQQVQVPYGPYGSLPSNSTPSTHLPLLNSNLRHDDYHSLERERLYRERMEAEATRAERYEKERKEQDRKRKEDEERRAIAAVAAAAAAAEEDYIQKQQAVEAVDHHFQLSMELVKKKMKSGGASGPSFIWSSSSSSSHPSLHGEERRKTEELEPFQSRSSLLMPFSASSYKNNGLGSPVESSKSLVGFKPYESNIIFGRSGKSNSPRMSTPSPSISSPGLESRAPPPAHGAPRSSLPHHHIPHHLSNPHITESSTSYLENEPLDLGAPLKRRRRDEAATSNTTVGTSNNKISSNSDPLSTSHKNNTQREIKQEEEFSLKSSSFTENFYTGDYVHKLKKASRLRSQSGCSRWSSDSESGSLETSKEDNGKNERLQNEQKHLRVNNKSNNTSSESSENETKEMQNGKPKKRGRKPKKPLGGKGDGALDNIKSVSLFSGPSSVSTLKKTGESFLQDASCFEVAPKLGKCRECRMTQSQRNKKLPKYFCRFYAFRRLRYSKNGNLSVAGFCHPLRDSSPEDLSIWSLSGSASNLSSSSAQLHLNYLIKDFYRILEQERLVQQAAISHGAVLAWKRVVQGVSEMCDVCDATLFNFHWACSKCGFVVCLDCYWSRKRKCENNSEEKESRTLGEEEENNNNNSRSQEKDKDTFSWLLCTQQQIHELDKLMITQIIAGNELENLQTALLSLTSSKKRTSEREEAEEFKMSDLIERTIETSMESSRHNNFKKSFKFLGTETDLHSNSKAFKTNSSSSSSTTTTTPHSSFSSSLISSTSSALLSSVTHTWLCNGKVLKIKTGTEEKTTELFKEIWKTGAPILISEDGVKVSKDLWSIQRLSEDFGELKVHLVDMENSSRALPPVRLKRFLSGFSDSGKKIKNTESGEPLHFLKVKNWPPFSGEEFSESLPSRTSNFLSSLPLHSITARNSPFNLASSLPNVFVRPDLGPRAIISYGSPLNSTVGTLNLHLQIPDSLYILVHGSSESTNSSELYSSISASAAATSSLHPHLLSSEKDSESRIPGAIWHVWHSSDAHKIRHFLNTEREFKEKTKKRKKGYDVIAEESEYLDESLREKLSLEAGVEHLTILQYPGEALLIPAGSPRQVKYIQNSISLQSDFLSPESVSLSLSLMSQLRDYNNDFHSPTRKSSQDKLQVKNVIFHSLKDALSSLLLSSSETVP